jgi:hypothetical protein
MAGTWNPQNGPLRAAGGSIAVPWRPARAAALATEEISVARTPVMRTGAGVHAPSATMWSVGASDGGSASAAEGDGAPGAGGGWDEQVWSSGGGSEYGGHAEAAAVVSVPVPRGAMPAAPAVTAAAEADGAAAAPPRLSGAVPPLALARAAPRGTDAGPLLQAPGGPGAGGPFVGRAPVPPAAAAGGAGAAKGRRATGPGGAARGRHAAPPAAAATGVAPAAAAVAAAAGAPHIVNRYRSLEEITASYGGGPGGAAPGVVSVPRLPLSTVFSSATVTVGEDVGPGGGSQSARPAHVAGAAAAARRHAGPASSRASLASKGRESLLAKGHAAITAAAQHVPCPRPLDWEEVRVRGPSLTSGERLQLMC